jgi:ElaB/YqjD/DUF883 family membrane-anchored ribosome-binding protein
MTTPDQIAHDIDQTRGSLRSNVEQLRSSTSPSSFLGRRVDKIKDSASSAKDRLMGSASNAPGAASSAASSAKDAAGAAPGAVRAKTEGNPLAAGLIAFGVGWMLSALVPASGVERQAAQQLEDNAGPVVEPLKQSAQEVAGNLQEPVQQSIEDVKSTASDAANRTTEHAKSAAADVHEPLTN